MTLVVSAFGASDVGRKRTGNEDSILVEPALGLYIVADGMGGASSGEIASQSAVSTIRDFIAASRPVFEQLAIAPSEELLAGAQAVVEKAIQEASRVIFEMAVADPKKTGMGCTTVCVVVAGATAIVGSVGDSRVFLVRRGHAHRLTEDHTLLASMIKEGKISKDEMKGSPLGSVLLRSVGTQAWVQVDTLVVALTHGDRLLLCSDGLHNYLDDKDVPVAIQGEPSEVPPRLIHFANDKGGKDNISAIILDFSGDAPNAMDAELPIEAMSAASLFQHMSYKEKSAILAVTHLHDYKAGEEIVSEGDTGDDIFVVVQGTANVMKQGITIAELGPGGHFGEMGLVDHTPRSATVRAKSDCSVLIIRRPALMAVMRKEATIGVKLLWGLVQTLSARLRVTNTDIVVLKQELAATMSRRDLPFEPATSNMRAPFDPSATMKSATPISTAVPPTRLSTPPPVSVAPASRPAAPTSRPAVAPRPPPAMLGTPATQRPPSTPRPGSIKPPSKR